jgi:Uma2 family endonuclease
MVMAASPTEWTADMLDDVPDDGRRWEVIDGQLLVTPGPDVPHQLVVGEIHFRLHGYFGRLAGARLIASPSDVRRGPKTRMQPDLFVVRMRDGKLPAYPFDMGDLLLTIEVVSPSSAKADRHDRRRAYLGGGVPEYWVVDADAQHIERWRTGDDRPELLTDSISFHAPGLESALTISLPELFADASRGL